MEVKKETKLRSWPGFTNQLCNDFFDKCNSDSELLIYPRADYFSVYCAGRGFAEIYPNKIMHSRTRIDEKHIRELLNDNAFCAYKDVIRAGMPQDKERRSQHEIVLRAQNIASDMLFCDFECKLPEEYLSMCKKPEVDYIAIDLSDASRPRPVLIEYKRTMIAISRGTSTLKDHYADFVEINECPKAKEAIADAAMFSFNKLIDMGRIKAKPISSIDADGLWFAFLFTDVPIKDFYGYLGKIFTLQSEANCEHAIPLRVASFASAGNVELCTDAFTDIKQYLRDNASHSSKRNRYKFDC